MEIVRVPTHLRDAFPWGKAQAVKKACHCEEAQRADVAIRNPVQQPPLSKGGGTAKP